MTNPRQALLRVLDESDRPLNMEEILGRMARAASGVPTTYRNLAQFAEQGLIEAILGPDQVVRYIRCHSNDHHHHIQCEQCGRMGEVNGCDLEKILDTMAARAGFAVTRHKLQLFGLCRTCRNGLEGRKPAP